MIGKAFSKVMTRTEKGSARLYHPKGTLFSPELNITSLPQNRVTFGPDFGFPNF